ncbi:MAG: hypothetical protein ACK55I_11420 [bacterium]
MSAAARAPRLLTLPRTRGRNQRAGTPSPRSWYELKAVAAHVPERGHPRLARAAAQWPSHRGAACGTG